MQGTIKANTVDKYLLPIRMQIVELVESDSTVIEHGCGNGDLLFKLSKKIRRGVGLDYSKQLIKYASKRAEREQVTNLEFKLIDLLTDTYSQTKSDYSIASLLLHTLPWEKAIKLTEKMISNSEITLLCGFSKPQKFKQKLLLWFDQRFNKHYSNFHEYEENGYTEGLLSSIQNIEYSTIDTFDPVIKIYKITTHNNV